MVHLTSAGDDNNFLKVMEVDNMLGTKVFILNICIYAEDGIVLCLLLRLEKFASDL